MKNRTLCSNNTGIIIPKFEFSFQGKFKHHLQLHMCQMIHPSRVESKCNGVDCNNCIFSGIYFKEFEKWYLSNQREQKLKRILNEV